MKRLSTLFLMLAFAVTSALNAQSLSGTVTSDGEAIIGANIAVAGTSTGTVSDLDGNYMLKLDAGSYDIIVSYTGYAEQRFNVTLGAGENKKMDIVMMEGVSLGDVVVTGSRTAPRSSTDTPLPIDVVSADDLILLVL